MKASLTRIQQILSKKDVEGLIADGAPDDEYDDEAKKILEALQRLNPLEYDEAHIVSIITLTWQKHFNLDKEDLEKRLPEIKETAREIINMLSQET